MEKDGKAFRKDQKVHCSGLNTKRVREEKKLKGEKCEFKCSLCKERMILCFIRKCIN